MAEPISRPVGTAFEQAMALLNQHSLLPKCIAFMLDRVLWHCSSTSPVSAQQAVLYPQVEAILAALHAKGIIAAACQSLVSTPPGVLAVLEQLSSAGYPLLTVCLQPVSKRVALLHHALPGQY